MATAMLMCASSALIPGLAYASTGHDAAGYSSPAPTPPVDTSSAESSPQSGVTTSHYMILVGPGQDPDQIGYRTGCTDGKSGTSGLRVLFFGTQEAGDKLRPPGTSITNKVPRVDHAAVERASLGWIRGFTQCGTATAVVAVATNNKADGGVGGADAGTAWAKLVERIASSTTSGRVTVGGGLDAEPKWSAPDWARGWVDGFVRSSSRRFRRSTAAACRRRSSSVSGMRAGASIGRPSRPTVTNVRNPVLVWRWAPVSRSSASTRTPISIDVRPT